MRVQTTMYTANADRLHCQRCCPPCVEPCVPTVPTGPPDPTGENSADAWGAVLGYPYASMQTFWNQWANALPILDIRTSAQLRRHAHACSIHGNVVVRLADGEHWVEGAFSRLVEVSGNLTITGCDSVTDLGTSFSSLRAVRGSVWMERSASSATAFGSAFSRLASTGGAVWIGPGFGPSLTYNFSQLRTVGWDTGVYDPDLETMGLAFSRLKSVDGTLLVNKSGSTSGTKLRTLGTAFARLEWVGESLIVEHNARLSTLGTAFARLEWVGNSLIVVHNARLSTLGAAFTAVGGVSVGADIVIRFNEQDPSPTARFNPEKMCFRAEGATVIWDLTPDASVQYNYTVPPAMCSP